jgi:hypothetical protein
LLSSHKEGQCDITPEVRSSGTEQRAVDGQRLGKHFRENECTRNNRIVVGRFVSHAVCAEKGLGLLGVYFYAFIQSL